MKKMLIITAFVLFVIACQNDTPASDLPMDSVLSITNGYGQICSVLIWKSSSSTEPLTIVNEGVAIAINDGNTFTWDISWTGKSAGESQYVYTKIYLNDTATPPIEWEGDMEIVGGQTVSYNTADL